MLKIDEDHLIEPYQYGYVLHTKFESINKKTNEPATSYRKTYYPPNIEVLFSHLLSKEVAKKEEIERVVRALKKYVKKLKRNMEKWEETNCQNTKEESKILST